MLLLLVLTVQISLAAVAVTHSRVTQTHYDCRPTTKRDPVVFFSSSSRHLTTEAQDAMEAVLFSHQLAEELKQIISTYQILSNSPINLS